MGVKVNLNLIYQTLRQSGRVVSIQQLQPFQTLLGDIQQELTHMVSLFVTEPAQFLKSKRGYLPE